MRSREEIFKLIELMIVSSIAILTLGGSFVAYNGTIIDNSLRDMRNFYKKYAGIDKEIEYYTDEKIEEMMRSDSMQPRPRELWKKYNNEKFKQNAIKIGFRFLVIMLSIIFIASLVGIISKDFLSFSMTQEFTVRCLMSLFLISWLVIAGLVWICLCRN